MPRFLICTVFTFAGASYFEFLNIDEKLKRWDPWEPYVAVEGVTEIQDTLLRTGIGFWNHTWSIATYAGNISGVS